MGELGRGEQSARMKAIILRGLLWAAVATADQSHHQSFKQGNSPAVHVSVHKPHGAVHALVHSQPAASPQSVHGYGGYEKPIVGVHAPAALPYHHAPEPYHAPIVHLPHLHTMHLQHLHTTPRFPPTTPSRTLLRLSSPVSPIYGIIYSRKD